MSRVRRGQESIYLLETFDVSTMRYCVYILFSQRDYRLYIGSTNNLKRRLSDHARGFVPATRYRRLLTLIFYEFFYSRDDALSREEYLKSGHGRRHLKEMLKTTLPVVGYKQARKDKSL